MGLVVPGPIEEPYGPGLADHPYVGEVDGLHSQVTVRGHGRREVHPGAGRNGSVPHPDGSIRTDDHNVVSIDRADRVQVVAGPAVLCGPRRAAVGGVEDGAVGATCPAVGGVDE